jgi:hypothetical protein
MKYGKGYTTRFGRSSTDAAVLDNSRTYRWYVRLVGDRPTRVFA